MSENHRVTTRGIVIGRRSAGEGSVRAEIYTEALGLVVALAKSAREERSKLRSHLTVGTVGTFTLVRGEKNWRMTGAIGTSNCYFVLSGRSATQKAAARIIGLARQLVHGEGENPALFVALMGFVASCPQCTNIVALERDTVAHILAALGYIPEATLTGDERTLIAAINNGLAASGL